MKADNKELKKRVEEYIKKRQVKARTSENLDKEELIEKLLKHQAELEIQNEELKNTLHELEEEHNKYSSLNELSSSAHLTLSRNGIIEEINLAGARMLGAERASLLKRRFSAFIHLQDENKYFSFIDELRKSKKIKTIELRLLRKDESSFYSRIISEPVTDGGSEQIKITLNDITRQREIRQQSIYKNFLESVFMGTAMPMFIVDIDENSDYIISGVNPAFEKITGMKNAEVRGKTLLQINGITSEAAKTIQSNYDSCVSERKSIQYRENFAIFDKNLYWLTTLTPLFNQESKVYRLIGSSMNITELIDTYKEIEAQKDGYEKQLYRQGLKLEKLDKQHNKILEAIGHGEWEWEIESDTVFYSPGWKNILGYKDDDLKNKFITLQNLIHPEDHSWVVDELSRYISNPAKYLQLTLRLKHKSGDYKWILLTGTSVAFENEHLKLIAGTITDISTQVEKDKELRRCREKLKKLE